MKAQVGAVAMGLLLQASALQAQWAATPRGLAAGGLGVVWETGVYGLLANPANLAWSDRPGAVTIALGTLGVGLDANLFPKSVYDRYFIGGETLGSDRADAVLREWFGPSAERQLYSQVDLVPIGIGLRTSGVGFGLALRSRLAISQRLSRGWLDLVLKGTAPDRELELNLDGILLHYTELTAGIALPIWRSDSEGALYVGVAPRIVLPMTYGQAELSSTLAISSGGQELRHRYRIEVRTAGELTRRWNAWLDEESVSGSWSVLSPTGSGWGVSVGLAYRRPNWVAAVALNDLGQAQLTKQAQRATNKVSEFLYRGIRLDPDKLKERFNNDLGEYVRAFWEDSVLSVHYRAFNRQSESLRVPLPAHVQGGFAYRPAGPLRVALAAGLGLTETAPPAALGLGLEYRLGGEGFFIPLRAGLQVGGHVPWALTGGLGLINSRTLDLDWGLLLHPSGSSGYRVRVGLGTLTLRF
ncbi:MAG: hypothetical protein RML47_09980 [Bacteroidota bacterium]|nr:hypothetical protein [Rhodothermia bacterium]MCS7154364.1 hypothetical protein [Bacteroidota bacterium]MDW8137739.1 hypothetical protein [Bacteroidota bacterium]MDW8286411.1 hypothetical protein [Bacteroidota bacterium]